MPDIQLDVRHFLHSSQIIRTDFFKNANWIYEENLS